MENRIVIEGRGGAVGAYVARPAALPAPGVVVLQELRSSACSQSSLGKWLVAFAAVAAGRRPLPGRPPRAVSPFGGRPYGTRGQPPGGGTDQDLGEDELDRRVRAAPEVAESRFDPSTGSSPCKWRPRAGRDGPVLLGVEIGKLLEKRDKVPDIVVFVGLAPTRHAGELEAVFDHPELLSRG